MMHEFDNGICRRCGIALEMAKLPDCEPVPGECPHCGSYIGVAWAAHARYCDLRPAAAGIAVAQHDSDKAAKGACECPTCVSDRADAVALEDAYWMRSWRTV